MDGNISYVFLPFSYGSGDKFLEMVNYLDRHSSWILLHDEIHYMFRFAAEKMDSRDREHCRCFHYQFNSSYRKQFNFSVSREAWYLTEQHSFQERETSFRFQILDVEMFCFSTGVGIMAFKLHFANNQPYWVSAAEYYLKKVSREQIRQETGIGTPVTILSLAETLLHECRASLNIEFFFYTYPETERANILTCLEVEPKEDYTEELFFLRRCYNDGFLFVSDPKSEENEIFYTSRDILWGISPEAAICLTMPADSRRHSFFDDKFYRNFENQYLFMYVLLLHRKYALYLFLTRIGVGMNNDIKRLEEYRRKLYEYETDYTFSRVTEVHQYQILYDRLEKVHALDKLYEDVREPLVSLGDVRREASEKKEKKRDGQVNYALNILALLGIASALVDSFDFIGSITGWFFKQQIVRGIQFVTVIIVAFISFRALIRLFTSKSDNNDD